jgi:hypothetical protein
LAWVQSIKPERLHSLSKSLDLAIRQLTRADLHLELNELESAAKLVNDEERKKTSKDVKETPDVIVTPDVNVTPAVVKPKHATKDSDDSDSEDSSTDSDDDSSSSYSSSSERSSSSSSSSVILVKEKSSKYVEIEGKPSNNVDKLIDEIDVLERKMNEVILKNSDAIEESNSPKKKDSETPNTETKESDNDLEYKTGNESEPKIEEKMSTQDSLAESLESINIS